MNFLAKNWLIDAPILLNFTKQKTQASNSFDALNLWRSIFLAFQIFAYFSYIFMKELKSLIDFIPLFVFFYLYKTTDKTDSSHPILQLLGASGTDNNHILVATAGLIGATVIVYGALFITQKFRLDKQQWFVLLMTVVFGGLTLALSDDYYIRLKAVLINLAFAGGIVLSPLFSKERTPIVQRLFGQVFVLDHKGWQRLNFSFALMFAAMASLHALFAFVIAGGEYWGEFTAFGDIIAMFGFLGVILFLFRKRIRLSE